MNLIRWLLGLFRGHKSGYSVKSFWGVIKHYNKDGVQIGYSRKTFWGRMNRYESVVFEKGKSTQKVIVSDSKEVRQEVSDLKKPQKKQQLQELSGPKEEKVAAPTYVAKDYSYDTEYVHEKGKCISINNDKEGTRYFAITFDYGISAILVGALLAIFSTILGHSIFS